MLPKKIPSLNGYEIEAEMRTASEVGGDYYDFHLSDHEKLTAVIGDATGHGMQAGIMVSAMKSLFKVLAPDNAPIDILNKGTKVVKSMKLSKMFMALTALTIEKDRIYISAAGMPYPLVYRAKSGSVEEIYLKGMPLGALKSFPYQEESVLMNEGDCMLLQSDGFEEMFNPKKELFGSDKVKKRFEDVGDQSPKQIIEDLMATSLKWAKGFEQQDDITFIVLKRVASS